MNDAYSKPTDHLSQMNPVDIQHYVQTDLEIRIENALGKGKENAIKMRELKQKLGLKTDRKIRLAIANMRLHNIGILSDTTHGYWCDSSYSECEDWLNFMTSYIADLAHEIKCIKTYAENKYHRVYQLPLFLK
jgi:hypothetical protein